MITLFLTFNTDDELNVSKIVIKLKFEQFYGNLISDHSYLNRLQTGMRGAFGKPQGLVARVAIGDFLLSVRVRDQVRI